MRIEHAYDRGLAPQVCAGKSGGREQLAMTTKPLISQPLTDMTERPLLGSTPPPFPQLEGVVGGRLHQ